MKVLSRAKALRFTAPPKRNVETSSNESGCGDNVDLSGAVRHRESTKLGVAMLALGAMALSAAPQAAQAAEQVTEAFSDIELVLNAHRSVAKPTDPMFEHKWTTPEQTKGDNGGVRYHFADGALDLVSAKHLTAEQLPEGSLRLTARGVDRNQTSKQYPDGQKVHAMSEPFKECTKFAGDGTCSEATWNSVSYMNLSCLYKNEDTGETVRVLHRSTMDNNTDSMDRGVCAGHRLVKESKWSIQPYQTDGFGKTLYVNPLHVVKMEVVSP